MNGIPVMKGLMMSPGMKNISSELGTIVYLKVFVNSIVRVREAFR